MLANCQCLAEDHYNSAAAFLRIFVDDPLSLTQEASISLEYYISKKGIPEDIALYQSEGLEEKQVAAIFIAFKKWKFKPAFNNKKPYRSHWLTTFTVTHDSGKLKLLERENLELDRVANEDWFVCWLRSAIVIYFLKKGHRSALKDKTIISTVVTHQKLPRILQTAWGDFGECWITQKRIGNV